MRNIGNKLRTAAPVGKTAGATCASGTIKIINVCFA